MHYSFAVKTAPVAEPVTLAEAKAHCHIDVSDEDDLVEALITAAREHAEDYCRRSFVRRTLEMRLDCFPAVIRLPRGPVSSVTHVKYTDSGGSLATMDADDYQADLYSQPARILPAFGATWPVTKPGTVNSVLVEYVAGYAPGAGSPTDVAENVPQAVKSAIKLIVAHLYENRELAAPVALTKLPLTVEHLLAPYEIRDYTLEA